MLCREGEEGGTRGQVISVRIEFDNDSVYRINSRVDGTVNYP